MAEIVTRSMADAATLSRYRAAAVALLATEDRLVTAVEDQISRNGCLIGHVFCLWFLQVVLKKYRLEGMNDSGDGHRVRSVGQLIIPYQDSQGPSTRGFSFPSLCASI